MLPRNRASRNPPWLYGEPHPDQTLSAAPFVLPRLSLYLFLERTVKNQARFKRNSNVRGVTGLNLRSRLIRNSPADFARYTPERRCFMPTITTKDGTQIYYKDWGEGQPVVFSHGWPLSADDWDTQMMFFLNHGYRVIAHDRRGHGRSSQPGDGHDMDHYAEDLKKISLPTLVMHGDDDQIVPYADSGPLSAKLVKGAVLKTYKGFPHGMPTTNAAEINADLLAFIKGEMAATV